MQYNLRNVSIIMGIASMILLFAIGSLAYLTKKLNSDIKRKYLDENEEDEEEEEEEGEAEEHE